ncbi:hypothetical protein ACHAWF_011416 [Thalassiosira exigua]
MAIPAALSLEDGDSDDEAKYYAKRSPRPSSSASPSPRRRRVRTPRSASWIKARIPPSLALRLRRLSSRLSSLLSSSSFLSLIFPAAATVTTDVWFQAPVVTSRLGYDSVLAATNVSGAFWDGFLSAWGAGGVGAIPSGPTTEALRLVADDVRTYHLSTYTSWAGMVNVAASIAHAKSSVTLGMAYVLLSVACAFVAHVDVFLSLSGLGSDCAHYMSPREPPTNKPAHARGARRLLRQGTAVLSCYVVASYLYVGGEALDDSVDEARRFWIAPTPRNQLAASTLFAIGGAHIGHLLAEAVSASVRSSNIPAETLVCNALFGLLGLSLNIMKLGDRSWGESLMLRGFAINFCGAASLFARHASDNRRLLVATRRERGSRGGARRAGINAAANILFATVLFWFAFEIEESLDLGSGRRRRGVMVKLIKILEKRRAATRIRGA